MGNLLQEKFANIGARVLVGESPAKSRRSERGIELNVGSDRKGEFFDLTVDSRRFGLEVLDVQPRLRHLLLMARAKDGGDKEKFLCGHDERHWFVAAVPPGSASNVITAMEALKPPAVVAAQARHGLSASDRLGRRNAAYVRQGEWFFVPVPEFVPVNGTILPNEPIRRGRGKAHWVEFLARVGGETVYVSRHYPQGLTEEKYRLMLARRPHLRNEAWRTMRRGAGVYARGRVRHPDHKTIVLGCWHSVFMNTESEAPAMRSVVFLD